MTHPNYYADEFQGQTVYRCIHCKHDTFSKDNAIGHQADANHPRVTLPAWESPYDCEFPQLVNKTVVVSVITSQSDHPTHAVQCVANEVLRLRTKGINAYAIWVDNGSASESIECVNSSYIYKCVLLPTNMGQSYARNLIIEHAIELNADYLVMVDGDIEIIPYSAGALSNYLAKYQSMGCVGMYSHNCTSDRSSNIATHCLSVEGLISREGSTIAWTQYGAFNMEVFRNGIRFDTSEVFQGQGWGFEDTDLYCQMLDKGWYSYDTKYFRYGHFRIHSSLRAMDPSLAAKILNARKSYVFNKWKDNPRVSEYAHYIVNQTMPVLT